MIFRNWLENVSKEMRIRVKDTLSFRHSADPAWKKAMSDIQGKWVPVETEHLFGDQFNTPVARVMIADVEDIENDVRPMAAKCQYCGACFQNVPDEHIGKPCPACDKYPVYDLAIIDRIRPLLTVENGKTKILYSAQRYRLIKTPEGEVRRPLH